METPVEEERTRIGSRRIVPERRGSEDEGILVSARDLADLEGAGIEGLEFALGADGEAVDVFVAEVDVTAVEIECPGSGAKSLSEDSGGAEGSPREREVYWGEIVVGFFLQRINPDYS